MDYKKAAIEFIEEFYTNNSEINGTGGLDRYLKESNYNEWLDKIKKDLDIANIPKDRVPAITYFYIREEDNKIIGMINIRLELNEFLKKEGGHIGYSIRPSERNKGYGSRMLSESIEFIRRIGLNNFILTCYKSNKASVKIIENNGGILDSEFYSDIFNGVIQRYIIK